MEKHISSLQELSDEAYAFIERLRPSTTDATLVTLSGELGAGKTAFVQESAKALGCTDVLTSPTFVLLKVYALPPGRKWTRLAHLDAYRLTHGGDLTALGFPELMRDSGTLLMLEWPERVSDALPPAATSLSFTVLQEGERRITYA